MPFRRSSLTERFLACARHVQRRELAELRDCVGFPPDTPLDVLGELIDDINSHPEPRAMHVEAAVARSRALPWMQQRDARALLRMLASVYEYLDARESVSE